MNNTIIKDLYIHVWDGGNGIPFMMESDLTTTLSNAIKDYWEQEGSFDYIHTIKLNCHTKEWDIMNIKESIDISEVNNEMERELYNQEAIIYGTHQEQIHNYYQSTRL